MCFKSKQKNPKKQTVSVFGAKYKVLLVLNCKTNYFPANRRCQL